MIFFLTGAAVGTAEPAVVSVETVVAPPFAMSAVDAVEPVNSEKDQL